MVAVGACDDGPVYDYARDVAFKVYALAEGEEAGTVVYDGEASQDALVRIVRKGKEYKVEFAGEKPCKVELVNAGAAAQVSGADWSVRGSDIVLSFQGNGTGAAVVTLA